MIQLIFLWFTSMWDVNISLQAFKKLRETYFLLLTKHRSTWTRLSLMSRLCPWGQPFPCCPEHLPSTLLFSQESRREKKMVELVSQLLWRSLESFLERNQALLPVWEAGLDHAVPVSLGSCLAPWLLALFSALLAESYVIFTGFGVRGSHRWLGH